MGIQGLPGSAKDIRHLLNAFNSAPWCLSVSVNLEDVEGLEEGAQSELVHSLHHSPEVTCSLLPQPLTSEGR